MQITITIPKLTTIRAHWKWGLLAALMLAFTLTWSSPAGAPSAGAAGPGPDFSINIDPGKDGTIDCDTKVALIGEKCDVPVGTQFTVKVALNDASSFVPPGYSGFQARINYGAGLTLKNRAGTDEMVDVNGQFVSPGSFLWPDCVFAGETKGADTYLGGCSMLPLPPLSTFDKSVRPDGVIMQVDFNCDTPGPTSVTMPHGFPGDTALFDEFGIDWVDKDTVETLNINCIVPPVEMSLDAMNWDPGDTGLQNCDLPSKPTKCEAALGQQFDIIIDVNAIKAPYDQVFTETDLGGLIFKPGPNCEKETIWPDYVPGLPPNCATVDDTVGSGRVSTYALSKAGKSGWLGPVVKLNVACPATPGSHKVTLVPMAASFFFGTGLANNTTMDFWEPEEQVPFVEVDSLTINCVPLKTEININPVQKNPGPPPFGCYTVLDDLKAPLFTVCDNNAQAGFPQTQPFAGLCDLDSTPECEDADPAKGRIRVSIVSGNYNVVESKPPPKYDPTNTPQQACDVKTQAKCELTFQNTAETVAWFPEDLDGNGQVALGDFLRVLAAFSQVKP